MDDAQMWQRAINDAEKKIADHRRWIAKLQRAVLHFKKNIEDGEPWPGPKSKSK